MAFCDTLDPELRDGLAQLSVLFPTAWSDLEAPARRQLAQPPVIAANGVHDLHPVRWSETNAGDAVRVRVYRPLHEVSDAPGALLIHGGGMWAGSLDSEHPQAVDLVRSTGMVVVSVDYRLAPEHRYPAAVDDTTAAWDWLVANAAQLGADPSRLAIVGGSAGGGLAVATALRVRDGGGPQPAFLLAYYPMLDSTNSSPSTRLDVPFPLWTGEANEEGWRWYLGDQEPTGYASPTHAATLSGLPPTFLDVGDHDIFVDEVTSFAARLRVEGVATELHVYPGVFHAAEHIAPTARISSQIANNRLAAIARVLNTAPVPAPAPDTVLS
ncbi:alpha/beta hydrolase [Microbacterium sp.]|uniref:alpha/beta hydrolase n=1 Tax=Microbacterium sp. TaxID=51671 RepID=UPI0039E30E78